MQMPHCDLHVDAGFAFEIGLNFFGLLGLKWQRRFHGWYDAYTPSYQYYSGMLSPLHGSNLPDCTCSLPQYGFPEKLCNTQTSSIYGSDAIVQFNYDIWGLISGSKEFQSAKIYPSWIGSSKCVHNSDCPPELFLCNKNSISCDSTTNGTGKFWRDCVEGECKPFYFCSPNGYKCTATTGGGPFSSLAQCQLSCPRYRCSSSAQCIQDDYGPYNSDELSLCQQKCQSKSCNTCADPKEGCCNCPYHTAPFCTGSCAFTCPGDFMACCM